MKPEVTARLLALADALGEALQAAGVPLRARHLDYEPYRCTLAPPADHLSAVRVPLLHEGQPEAGLRARIRAGDQERIVELSAAELANRDAATFVFPPLEPAGGALAELTLESAGLRGARVPAIALSAAGRPALLYGHGDQGAVTRARRPALLSRDNWIEALRVLGEDGPRALASRLVRRLTTTPPPPRAPWRDRYPEWLLAHATPDSASVDRWQREAAAAHAPRIAVLLLPGEGAAASSRASIAGQLWPASSVLELREPGWPALAADYLVPLRSGDLLPPHALLRYAAAAGGAPLLITADEDRLSSGGLRGDAFFKPGLSPSRLRCEDYIAGAAAFRVDSALGETAGLRSWEGALWDAALRRAERGPVARVEDVLYQRLGPRPAAPEEDARLLLSQGAARAGWKGAEVRPGRSPGTWRVAPALRGAELVSIVIPFRDKPELLDRLVLSIREKSTYPSIELLLVDNGSREEGTRALLERLQADGARVVPEPGPFNFARINNAAARQATGEYLLFLNNDTEVLEPGWLEALLEQAQRPEVGAVGARLLFPEGRMQHAGVLLGLGGIAGHAGRLLPPEGGGYHRSFDVVHDYSAVTAACLLIQRALFEDLGGFDEALAVSFNDVDLCLRLRQRGLLVVYTPFAELLHHESISRGPRVATGEIARMRERHGAILLADPYYNRHLSLERDDYEVQP